MSSLEMPDRAGVRIRSSSERWLPSEDSIAVDMAVISLFPVSVVFNKSFGLVLGFLLKSSPCNSRPGQTSSPGASTGTMACGGNSTGGFFSPGGSSEYGGAAADESASTKAASMSRFLRRLLRMASQTMSAVKAIPPMAAPMAMPALAPPDRLSTLPFRLESESLLPLAAAVPGASPVKI